MGEIWTGQLDQTWKKGGNPLVATGSGYVPGRYVWRHNGTTWVIVWTRDITPPATPNIGLVLVGKNVVNVGVQHGSLGPIKRTVVKVNYTGSWPSNPGTKDGDYYAQTTTGGGGIPEEWSEYWKGYPDVVGATGWKTIPASYQTFTIPLSTVVRVAAWAQDDYYNWSAAGVAQITTLAPDPPAPTLREVSTEFDCNDAGQWSTANKYWTSSGTQNGYGGSGGDYGLEGYWFYNGQVQSNLSNLVAGLEVRAYLYRVNSSHGVSGAATVKYAIHRSKTKPAGRPGIEGAFVNATLNRGEGKWVGLDGGWMQEMKDGTICGLATGGVGVTAYTSAYYWLGYGRGTPGGKWYMRWQQY